MQNFYTSQVSTCGRLKRRNKPSGNHMAWDVVLFLKATDSRQTALRKEALCATNDTPRFDVPSKALLLFLLSSDIFTVASQHASPQRKKETAPKIRLTPPLLMIILTPLSGLAIYSWVPKVKWQERLAITKQLSRCSMHLINDYFDANARPCHLFMTMSKAEWHRKVSVTVYEVK